MTYEMKPVRRVKEISYHDEFSTQRNNRCWNMGYAALRFWDCYESYLMTLVGIGRESLGEHVSSPLIDRQIFDPELPIFLSLI